MARLAYVGGRVLGCDPALVAAPALAVAGTVMGRSAVLDLGFRRPVTANLCVACVAPAGTDAAEAIGLTLEPARRIDEFFRKAHRAEIARWLAQPAGLPVPRVRLLETGLTLRGLMSCAGDDSHGVLVAYDELPPWMLGATSRGQATEQATLRKLWAGGDWPLAAGSDATAKRSHVSLVGAVTADSIAARGRALDRWLWVCPDRVARETTDIQKDVDQATLDGWSKLVHGLLRWRKTAGRKNDAPHLVRLNAEGLSAFRSRAQRHAQSAEAPAFPDAMRGAHAALEAYAGRFCLILSGIRHAELSGQAIEPNDIGPEIVEAAWDLVAYFGTQARRIRAQLRADDRDPMPDGARWIVAWLSRNPGTRVFPEGELTRWYAPSRGFSRLELNAGLAWLAQRSALRRTAVARKSGTPGPKPATWEVHPDLDPEVTFA
jgi:hypothetical protein